MATVAAIVINDGASTPVAHTFAPSRVAPELVTYQDRLAGVVAGFNILSIGTRYADKKNGAQKVTVRMALPTLAVTAPTTTTGIQPVPVAAFECFANLEFVLPSASSVQNRKDLFTLIKNALANSTVYSAVVDLDPPY
jgi:hypothetical protein